MIYSIEIKKADAASRPAIIAMLEAEKLPTKDLPYDLENFLVAWENLQIVGVIGLEVFGKLGLLRSMVVNDQHRNKGIAGKLVSDLESIARSKGIGNLFLLTETAAMYFERLGYRIVDRSVAPEAIQASSEFSSLCPASATLMQKEI